MAPIPSSTRTITYNPVASTGPFPVGSPPFPIFDPVGADLLVTLDGAAATGWTFTGVLESGFYGAPNTYTGSISFAAPITGVLVIKGKRAPRRQAQFAEGRGIPARDHNTEYNLLTAVDQELRRDIDDALTQLESFADDVADTAAAAASAVAAYDAFDDRYLGEKSSFPTLDNDGNALVNGTLVSIIGQADPLNDGMYVRRAGAWVSVGVLPAAFQRMDGVTIAVDGQTSVPVSGGYVPGQIVVFLNGLKLELGASPGVGTGPGATASDGANIVFPASLLLSGHKVEWIITRPFIVAGIAAVDTTFVPAGGVAATTVQAAIAELDAEKVPATRTVATSGLAGGGGALSADRTIDVPIASQAEAEAASVNTRALTPLRGGQLVDAKLAGIGVEGREFGVTATVAASALTVALKKPDLSGDATPAAPLTFAFRDPTLASGGVTKRLLTAAVSLVISNGSTMGVTTNNAAFRLWLVLFDDASTLRLGLVNARSDGAVKFIAPLSPQTVGNSTAEGGAGAADSPGVFYTGAAVSSKTYIVLASLDWDTGLPAIGVWSVAPTRITPWSAGQPLPGQTIQSVFVNSAAGGANGTTTYAIPSGGLLVLALLRPQNAVKVTASAAGLVAATATAVNPNLQATLFRNAVDLGCTRTLGLSNGAGGININVSDTVAMQVIDYPLSTSAQTYSYQHKTTASGINVTSSNISLSVEEICS